MGWTVEFSASALDDLGLIFDHLVDSHIALGDDLSEALDLAASRISHIQDQAERIATAPHRGEAHDELLDGLRHLTLGRAVYWFDLDETRQRLRILAVFYGGQDHRRQMLFRLLSKG